MRCLVTGAAGFVGSSLCDSLLRDGHEVVGVDCYIDYYPRSVKESNLEQARDYSTFEFVEGNLLTLSLPELVEGAELVFHQAAQAGVRASWGEYFSTYTHNNILATQLLLEACKGSESIQKVVYASSSSVYGTAESFPTSETVLPCPISPYGVTKLAAEHLMVLYAKEFNVPTTSLRYFTVYGPRQRPDMAFHRFIRAGITGEELTLYGDGEQTRDFTFIDDIVAANVLAAEKGSAGSVYNIGGGSRVSMNQVIETLRNEIGTLKVGSYERQRGDARHTSADTSKAQSELGYSPGVQLFDGIKKEIEWLETQLRT